jgi:hypothetical protein
MQEYCLSVSGSGLSNVEILTNYLQLYKMTAEKQPGCLSA